MPIDFQTLLNQQSLVRNTVPDAAEIVAAVDERVKNDKPLNVMYGETYDRFGPTLDSLKYYFTVAAIGKVLQQSDARVTPTILIADIATCRNESEDQHDELMSIGRERAAFLTSINEHYALGLDVLLMSEYLHTDEFQARLARIRDESDRRSDLLEWVKQTVPASKVEIEQQKGFAYAFEEIATIIEYDVKVGPPREKFYDEPTRMIGKTLDLDLLLSVYLHPTYPLGFGFDFFFANEEIETYGVTAYKAGSKGLSDHRIVFGETSEDRLDQLVEASFVGKKAAIPNPVLDLCVIAEMARQWLEGDLSPIDLHESFYSGGISPKELKQRACTDIRSYILDPVRSIVNGATH